MQVWGEVRVGVKWSSVRAQSGAWALAAVVQGSEVPQTPLCVCVISTGVSVETSEVLWGCSMRHSCHLQVHPEILLEHRIGVCMGCPLQQKLL